MSEHLTHFRTLIEQSDAFYNALYRLDALEQEVHPAHRHALAEAELRRLAQEKLAELRTTLVRIEREHGLVVDEDEMP